MSVFIRKVSLGNYRSIAQCEVELGPVTFLIGANGSGKSNFLDALRLISDALNRSLDHALRDRGGLEEVRRRSGGHPTHFSVRVDFDIGTSSGFYAFKVGAKKQGTWSISHEERGLPTDLQPPDRDPGQVRDAKGWLARQMPRRYHETVDQPALAACFDLQVARSAASFERSLRKVAALLQCELPEHLSG